MDVSRDHRGRCVEKTRASGEPGAWKSCMPWFGGGRLEKGWFMPVPRWPPILQRRSGDGRRCVRHSSASPVRMVKPVLVEPQFPAVHSYTCRSTSGATTPYESVGTDDWRRLSAASDLQRVGSRERNEHLHALYVSRGSMRDRLPAERLRATESP